MWSCGKTSSIRSFFLRRYIPLPLCGQLGPIMPAKKRSSKRVVATKVKAAEKPEQKAAIKVRYRVPLPSLPTLQPVVGMYLWTSCFKEETHAIPVQERPD